LSALHGTSGIVPFIVYVLSVGAFLGTLVVSIRGPRRPADDQRSVRPVLRLLAVQLLLVGLILGFSAHGELQSSSRHVDSDDLSVSETEIALLVERADHLEGLLAGGLFVFFLAALAGFFAAAKGFRRDSETPDFSARQLFYGITVSYALLGGFCYYMLSEYYTTLSTVLRVLAGDSTFGDLVQGLQTPSLGLPLGPAPNVIMLLGAPLFPLAVSITLTMGMYLYLRDSKTGLRTKDLSRATALHAAICPLIVAHAFAIFLSVGPLAPKENRRDSDDMQEDAGSSTPSGLAHGRGRLRHLRQSTDSAASGLAMSVLQPGLEDGPRAAHP